MTKQPDKIYLKLHKSYVKEDLLNSETQKRFNLVTLPKDTMIDGQNVGGYTFSPLFVNTPNLFKDRELVRDENGIPMPNTESPMREIPCMKDKEIWLQKDGDTVKVLPEKLADALKENRTQYLAQQKEAKKEQTQEQSQTKEAPVQDTPAPEQKEPAKPKKRPSPAELGKQATARAKAYNEEHKAQMQEQPAQKR